MNAKVSILIPSIRPASLAACLDSIHRFSQDVDYEVVLVAPFTPVPHPRVVHVQENKPQGVYCAAAIGMEQVAGEYLIHIADDCRATPKWASNMLRFMEQHNGIVEGNFRHFNAHGERPLPTMFGKLYAPFICIKREVVKQIGGLMDWPYYRSFYGDPDLSMRVWNAGGKVATCPDAWVYHADCDDAGHAASVGRSEAIDKERFVARWQPVFTEPFKGSIPASPPFLDATPPPEACAQIVRAMVTKDWQAVERLIESSHDCFYADGLSVVRETALNLRHEILKREVLKSAVAWSERQGLQVGSDTDRDFSLLSCVGALLNRVCGRVLCARPKRAIRQVN